MQHEPLQFPPRPTQLARMILRGALREGDLAVDATAGNGHDTVFLAECVGAYGRVMAFDVLEDAIRSAEVRVAESGLKTRVTFFQTSHATMAEHFAPESVAVVVFNLGYLPGGDHSLATETSETLAAMDAASLVLRAGGVISVICYPGHPEGEQEASAVESHLTGWSCKGWRIAKYAVLGTLKPAPFLIIATKPEAR